MCSKYCKGSNLAIRSFVAKRDDQWGCINFSIDWQRKNERFIECRQLFTNTSTLECAKKLTLATSTICSADEGISSILRTVQIIALFVDFDRSWRRRSDALHHTIVAVIDAITGLVIDYCNSSTYCQKYLELLKITWKDERWKLIAD